MNHHCVPDFEMDGDYSIPCSTRNSKKSCAMAEDEDIMELLWQNGQVVAQSQRSGRKPHEAPAPVIPNAEQSSSAAAAAGGEIRSAAAETAQQQLFMQEDEMASWLQSPLDDTSFERDIYADLLYPPPMSAPAPSREFRTSAPEIRPQPPPPAVVAPRPPMHPASPRFQNFMHFSRLPQTSATVAMESAPSSSSKAVVDSNETPMVGPRSRASTAPKVVCGSMTGNEAAGTSTTAKELITCEVTVTSSPGGSSASVSASAEPPRTPHGQKQPPATAEDRKRKGREAADDNEGHSMDPEFESGEGKKQAHGSTSTKRSRAAEVHNLSERRRRDRINEKMRALQELIPRCNKSDKASMLDEAIEYLKSLQLQVQMMSMGCSMVPLMYPGVHQYIPAMGMGMGMGMGMDIGMNRPMVPYPPLLPGSATPNPAATAHMGPRFPMPAFHMPPIPVPDPSRVQTSTTSDLMRNSLHANNPNQPQHPNFVDPYQQFISFHQMQVPQPQNQAVVQPGSEKPGSSKEVANPENHQSGG